MKQLTFDKILWRLIAYILHPIFVPVYLFAFLIYCNSPLFAANTVAQTNSLLLNVIMNLVLYPLFTLLLLKALKFIDSFYLPTSKSRIVPVFAFTIYAFWVWAFVLMKNPANYPTVAIRVGLCIFLTSSITLVCNAFYKISLHAIGAGMAVALAIVTVAKYSANPLWLLFAALMAVAILGSRKHDSDHTTVELYSGFICGLLVMLVVQFIGV